MCLSYKAVYLRKMRSICMKLIEIFVLTFVSNSFKNDVINSRCFYEMELIFFEVL